MFITVGTGKVDGTLYCGPPTLNGNSNVDSGVVTRTDMVDISEARKN